MRSEVRSWMVWDRLHTCCIIYWAYIERQQVQLPIVVCAHRWQNNMPSLSLFCPKRTFSAVSWDISFIAIQTWFLRVNISFHEIDYFCVHVTYLLLLTDIITRLILLMFYFYSFLSDLSKSMFSFVILSVACPVVKQHVIA